MFHPDEPDGRQRLLDLGVSRAMSAAEPPQALLDAINEAASTERRFRETITELDGTENLVPAAPTRKADPQTPRSVLTVVTGVIEEVGATELAIEVTAQLRRRDETAVLVDADLMAPNLAQRLQAPLTANVYAAIDAVQHTLTDPSCLTMIPRGGFELLGGVEHPKHWQDLDPDDPLAVLEALRERRQHVVVNVGSQLEALPSGRHDAARTILRAADRVLVATDPTPTGLVRLSRWMVDARELTEPGRVHVVVNRSDARDARAQLDAVLIEELLGQAAASWWTTRIRRERTGNRSSRWDAPTALPLLLVLLSHGPVSGRAATRAVASRTRSTTRSSADPASVLPRHDAARDLCGDVVLRRRAGAGPPSR